MRRVFGIISVTYKNIFFQDFLYIWFLSLHLQKQIATYESLTKSVLVCALSIFSSLYVPIVLIDEGGMHASN